MHSKRTTLHQIKMNRKISKLTTEGRNLNLIFKLYSALNTRFVLFSLSFSIMPILEDINHTCVLYVVFVTLILITFPLDSTGFFLFFVCFNYRLFLLYLYEMHTFSIPIEKKIWIKWSLLLLLISWQYEKSMQMFEAKKKQPTEWKQRKTLNWNKAEKRQKKKI